MRRASSAVVLSHRGWRSWPPVRGRSSSKVLFRAGEECAGCSTRAAASPFCLVQVGLLGLEGTSIPPLPRAFARPQRRRSRHALAQQGSLLARLRGRGATRGICRLPHSGLLAAMRALECPAQPIGTGASRAGSDRSRSSDQPPLGIAGASGRGHEPLTGVLGFHLDWQTVGGRRAQAHVRSSEGAPNPVERGAVHACPARSGCWGSAPGTRRKACSWPGSRSVRGRFRGHEAGRRLRSRGSRRWLKRAARRETGCSRAVGSVHHAEVEVRFGCSLTSWARTSSLDASRPGSLRQEGLLRAPQVLAAQGRMSCAVSSWASVRGTAFRASIRLGRGAAVGNHRSEPKDETLVGAFPPCR